MELNRARRLFIEVSIDCPASTIGQAACIALTCIKESDNPDGLLLLDNPTDLALFVNVAQHFHQNVPDQRKPVGLDEARVANIINREHLIAQQLLGAGLTVKQLEEIHSMYALATEAGIHGIVRERILAELIERDHGIDLSRED